MELLIGCKCAEANIMAVTRYMNREIVQIFYQNGINVPFPNVTVSQLDTEGRKTMQDFRSGEGLATARKAMAVIRSNDVTVTGEDKGVEEALQMTDRIGAD